jgi:Uma2 family endonuclease
MAYTATGTVYRVPNTLPSDTEESVLGTEWHQEAAGALADVLRAVAVRRGASWGVCEGIALVGLQHEDGTDYDPRPDVMVLARPLRSGSLAWIHLRDAGVPLCIAEVASDSTKTNDQGDKRHAYAAIGVPEYLVFDPDGALLSAPLLGWRLEGEQYVPWLPDAEGWWHSASLGVSFRPAPPFLDIRDRDGSRVERSSELRRRLQELEQARIVAEEARAKEAQRRAAAEQARIVAEEARAKEAQRRAAAEEARAVAEQARAELEERLRQLLEDRRPEQ